MSYCQLSLGHPVHGPHHDLEYGRPVFDDRLLFERLSLEINQAGLSWLLVLNKRKGLNAAFAGFEPEKVARFGEADRQRLLQDASIIRNRRKIDAVIENARRVCSLQRSHGSFRAWLDAGHPRPLKDWVRLMRQTFVFMGPEVVNEFLMSTGYLPGAHDPDCPIGEAIRRLDPPWMRAAPSQGW